jgi:hypothetical protein
MVSIDFHITLFRTALISMSFLKNLGGRMKIDHSVLRFLSLVIGGFSIFLGYLLFVKGVTGDATLVVGAKTLNGQLLNAAPGLFFAISGVLIVFVSLYRKIEERHYAPRVQEEQFETGLGELP